MAKCSRRLTLVRTFLASRPGGDTLSQSSVYPSFFSFFLLYSLRPFSFFPSFFFIFFIHFFFLTSFASLSLPKLFFLTNHLTSYCWLNPFKRILVNSFEVLYRSFKAVFIFGIKTFPTLKTESTKLEMTGYIGSHNHFHRDRVFVQIK